MLSLIFIVQRPFWLFYQPFFFEYHLICWLESVTWPCLVPQPIWFFPAEGLVVSNGLLVAFSHNFLPLATDDSFHSLLQVTHLSLFGTWVVLYGCWFGMTLNPDNCFCRFHDRFCANFTRITLSHFTLFLRKLKKKYKTWCWMGFHFSQYLKSTSVI